MQDISSFRMFMLYLFSVVIFYKTNMRFVEQKYRLAESVNSELRSSGWADDVCNFMRATKRCRIQNSDMPQSFDAKR